MISSSAIRISFPSTIPIARKLPKNSNGFCAQSEPLAGAAGRNQRHGPDRDRHREEVSEDRDRAAQQAGIEAGDGGDDQSDIDHRIEAVHERPFPVYFQYPDLVNESGLRSLQSSVSRRALRALAELNMSGLFDVSKETILITGASQGLGRQFARVLSAHGAAVVLAARQTAKLKSLEDEIRGKGGRAAAVQMDVTDIASIAGAIDAAEAALGPVSVLVNNAGIAIEKLAIEQTEADWDSVINANLKGAYFAATEMARRMIARRQEGNIVNIASVLGFGVMKFLSPYTISKAGIVQATKVMALELAGNRIRVNALAPGYIDTEMNHDFWSTPSGEKLAKRIPQRRVGAESDLDVAIMLLASSASRYMTGSVVTVDGGFLLT
jgi:3-oxoacyl-[acyl-carrier protein] reductase